MFTFYFSFSIFCSCKLIQRTFFLKKFRGTIVIWKYGETITRTENAEVSDLTHKRDFCEKNVLLPICREHWYNSLNECKSNGTNVVEWYSQPLEFFWQFLAQKQIDLHLNNNPWVFLAICKFKICLETKNMIAENTARKYYRIFLVKGKVARIHYVLCVILHLLAERTRLEKCTAFAVASLYYIPLEISPTGHCG